jgi:NADH-quinone oxidoreductase subunit C/D
VEMTINMGPQHPSTHGVFRMVLALAGERVQAAEPFIGYLHRGAEKLGEAGDVEGYRKAVIWLDRTDYLSVWPNEHCYMLALEKLAGITVPERAEYLRVILSELGRVNSHCMFYGAFGADAGATTPFMYAFTLREELYGLFEAVGGQRLFPNYFRPGGLREDVPPDFVERTTKTVDTAYRACDEFEALLTTNEIFLSRTRGIGVITPERAIDLGLSGPVLRATGIPLDIRRAEPYSIYDRFDFDVPVGVQGDCYERYLIRVEEMRQSLRIIEQCLRNMPAGPYKAEHPLTTPPLKERTMHDIETLIAHFLNVSWGPVMPVGEAMVSIEATKGMNGYYLISDGNTMPYRVHIRTPSFPHLQTVPLLSRGYTIADLLAILGSIDFVLADVDR